MGDPERIFQYLEHTRALLQINPKLYGVMVQRQIEGRLLPELKDSGPALRNALWHLLHFCLAGPEGEVPEYSAASFLEVGECVQAPEDAEGSAQIRFPRAARVIWERMNSESTAEAEPVV